MNEHELRIAVYKLPISPAVKLVLIGIVSRVNWQTWTGEISSRDLSQRMNVALSTVRSALKQLSKAGLISIKHNTAFTPSGKNIHKRSTVTINVKSIGGVSRIDTPPPPRIDTPPPPRIDTPLPRGLGHPPPRIGPPPPPRIGPLTIEDNNYNTIEGTIEDQRQARAERDKTVKRAKKLMKKSYR